MIVLEFKAQGKTTQYKAIDEAIRTAQFVRNCKFARSFYKLDYSLSDSAFLFLSLLV
jgi:hypothetical protein